jgi:hypothetical protein
MVSFPSLGSAGDAAKSLGSQLKTGGHLMHSVAQEKGLSGLMEGFRDHFSHVSTTLKQADGGTRAGFRRRTQAMAAGGTGQLFYVASKVTPGAKFTQGLTKFTTNAYRIPRNTVTGLNNRALRGLSRDGNKVRTGLTNGRLRSRVKGLVGVGRDTIQDTANTFQSLLRSPSNRGVAVPLRNPSGLNNS